MTAAKQLVDDKFLRNFAPFGDLDAERFSRIAKQCTVEQYDAGCKLFQIGDRDNRTIYLLSGQVVLTFRSGTQRIITAETNQARNALVPEQPRQASAVAKTAITLLIIESEVLDQVIHWNDNGYEISELEVDEDNDWMTMFLQSKAFLKLRAQNIQALMMRLEEIPVKSGQVIVRQGDDDGYYYIVKRGTCRVTRKPTPNSAEIEVAVLGVGAGFGEEALIMHDPRGATVTMTSNGLLMRLSRSDFTRLLAEPLVQIVTYKNVTGNPNCVFLDVRSPDEFMENGIKNSESSPLAELRAKIHSFDTQKQYVMVSNDGGRASAAAFLLCQQGLDAVVLEKGLLGVPHDVPRGHSNVNELDNIPTVDNVVDFSVISQASSDAKTLFDVYDQYDDLEEMQEQFQVTESEKQEKSKAPVSEADFMNDPRVKAIFTHAKQRVNEEAKRAQSADMARRSAEKELQRLKKEAELVRLEVEKAHQNAESAMLESDEVARLESIHESARMREVELACKQAEVEEAIKQAEEEAQRAYTAELAYREAQEENARLKREMHEALQRTQEQAKKSEEAMQIFAEKEAKHYKEMTKKRARAENRRVRAAERAQKKAESEIERLKAEADATRAKLEEQAKILADEARSAAEQDAARARSEELAKEQAEKEAAIQQATIAAEKAAKAEEARRNAEAQLDKLRSEADEARDQAAELAKIAADQARSEAEQEAAIQKAKMLAEKQVEIDEAVRIAEAESARARAAEEAQRIAEEEIDRVRQAAARDKAKIEAQALRIAEQARLEAEKLAKQQRAEELAAKQSEIELAEQKAREEAERAYAAEQARLQAESEIEKLKTEAERARAELEKQLNADIKRSEVEHEVAQARAEELIHKQSEIDEIAQVAEQASLRAIAAEEARLNAELEIERLNSEIEQARKARNENASNISTQQFEAEEAELKRKQMEILEIGKTLEQEARRVQAAEQAQVHAQEEIERLRVEVETLKRQAQEQLTEDAQHSAAKNAAVREQAEELARKQFQIEEATKQAQIDAQRAKQAINARIQAEQEIKRLKEQSEWAISQAKEMVRRTKVEAKEQYQRELAQARAEAAAVSQAEAKEAARKARLEAKRAEAAEKARIAAEREIERLKVSAEVQRIKAENTIKESIKAANRSAAIKGRAPARAPKLQGPIDLEQPLAPEESLSTGVDYFNYEPPSDLEVQDDMSLLFTNIDVNNDQPRGAADLIKAMSKEHTSMSDDDDDDKEVEQSNVWVSDQVMWEATLGIREDAKAQNILEPKKKDNTPSGFFTFGNQSEPEPVAPPVRQPRKAEPKADSKRSVFQSRELNPMARKSIDVSMPRSVSRNWFKNVKVALWISPLMLAIGYYFSLSDQKQIDLQLKAANSVRSLFGSSNKDDISKKAELLIQQTEQRIKDDSGSGVDRIKQARKSRESRNYSSSDNNRRTTSRTNRPDVRDTRAERRVTKVTSIPAPEPVAQVRGVSAQTGEPTLPPLPDVNNQVNYNTKNTVSSPEKTGSMGSSSVPDHDSRNDRMYDVNADQNTAILPAKDNSNLETQINQ